MALKTEIEYENIFGDHITLLTGLEREVFVKPMKQLDGTRIVKRVGNDLVPLTPSDNWCAYHIKFNELFEEPYTVPDQSMVIAKRFLRVEYNFYGPEAANNALRLEKLLYTQASYQNLIANGIVYSEVRQNVIDMDMSFNKQWWTRRNLSISFLESVEIEFPAGIVEEIDLTKIEIHLINDIAPRNPDCELIAQQTILWDFNDGLLAGWIEIWEEQTSISNPLTYLLGITILSFSAVGFKKDTGVVAVATEKFYIEGELFSDEWNLTSVFFSVYKNEITSENKIVYISVANGFNTSGSLSSAPVSTIINFAGVFEVDIDDKILTQSGVNFLNSGVGKDATLDNVKLIKITGTIFEEMTAQEIFNDRVCQTGRIRGDQLLDNRDDFIAWDIDGDVVDNYWTLDEDHIFPYKYATVDVLLEEDTEYTILWKIYFKETNANELQVYGGPLDATEILDVTPGIHSQLVLSNSEINNNTLIFKVFGSIGQGIGVRVGLVEGDYTLLTDAQKEDIIEKAEFGPFIVF